MSTTQDTLPSLLPLLGKIGELRQHVWDVPWYGCSYTTRMLCAEFRLPLEVDSVEVRQVKDEVKNLLMDLDARGLMPDL